MSEEKKEVDYNEQYEKLAKIELPGDSQGKPFLDVMLRLYFNETEKAAFGTVIIKADYMPEIIEGVDPRVIQAMTKATVSGFTEHVAAPAVSAYLKKKRKEEKLSKGEKIIQFKKGDKNNG